MQTAMTRANMVFTFFATVAAALAIAVTLSDLLHTPDPPVAIKLRSVKQLGHAPRVRADVAALSLSLEADLSKAFSWNTKQLFVFLQADYATPGQPVNQVVVWDKIMQSRDDAKVSIRSLRPKYPFVDRGAGLRGADVNLTLAYNIMPRVGRLVTRSVTVRGGRLPSEYTD